MTEYLEFDAVSHSYTLQGFPVPSVTRVLSPLQDYDPTSQYLETARQRGTDVHTATELHDRRRDAIVIRDDKWRPDGIRGYITATTIAPYLDAWKKFLADTDFEIHEIEKRVCSLRHRYAGTLDRLGVLNGRRVVIDIKTTAKMSPVMGIQLAAYQFAVNEKTPWVKQYPYRFICQLKPDGSYRLEEFKDKSDFTVFLALLTIHSWRSRHGN